MDYGHKAVLKKFFFSFMLMLRSESVLIFPFVVVAYGTVERQVHLIHSCFKTEKFYRKFNISFPA